MRSGSSLRGPYDSDLVRIDPLCLPNPFHSHGEALFQLIRFQCVIILVNNLRIGSDVNPLFIDDDESATLRDAVNRSKERKDSLLLPLGEPRAHQKHCHHQQDKLKHENLFELHHQPLDGFLRILDLILGILNLLKRPESHLRFNFFRGPKGLPC
jgi:hypothetical protein